MYYAHWQRFWLRRDQGRIDETGSFIDAWVPDASNIGRYLRFIAVRYAELGDVERARQAFEEAAAQDFGAKSFDNTWVHNIALASEVCVAVGDAKRAALLYGRLSPYAERNVNGGDIICLGSVSRYLMLLAGTLRLHDEAERHALRAIEQHARMGARPFLARSQYEYARLLRDAGRADGAGEMLAQAEAIALDLGMNGLLECIDRTRAG
jgi:hypothetical protein